VARERPAPRCVLLDIGGTIWSETWVEQPEADFAERLDSVRRLLPELGEEASRALLAALLDEAHGPDAVVGRVLGEHGVRHEPAAVRRAICLPARPRTKLLPGADLLPALRRLHQLGLPGRPLLPARLRRLRDRRRLRGDRLLGRRR
jgi:hypothetical protein